MVTEGEREMSFRKIIHGLLGHSKKFRRNSKCNGKSVKDLKQRSDVIQSSFWLLLLGEYTRGRGVWTPVGKQCGDGAGIQVRYNDVMGYVMGI